MPTEVAELGMDQVFYLNGVEAENVQDVTINMTRDEVEVTTRAAEGYKQYVATLREVSIELTCLLIVGDPTYETLKSAFYGDKDTALVDVRAGGISGRFVVTNFSREEPIGDAVKINVTLKRYDAGA